MYAFIKKTIETLGMRTAKLKLDVFTFLTACNEQYDFILQDALCFGSIDELSKIVISKKLIAAGGFLCLEHTPRNNYEKYEGFSFQRNYGTTVFFFCFCSKE
jgi:hypothetical protein